MMLSSIYCYDANIQYYYFSAFFVKNTISDFLFSDDAGITDKQNKSRVYLF